MGRKSKPTAREKAASDAPARRDRSDCKPFALTTVRGVLVVKAEQCDLTHRLPVFVLEQDVMNRVERGTSVIFDFDHLPIRLSVRFLLALCGLHRKVNSAGGSLRLCGLNAEAREALVVAGCHFETRDDVDEAVREVAPTRRVTATSRGTGRAESGAEPFSSRAFAY